MNMGGCSVPHFPLRGRAVAGEHGVAFVEQVALFRVAHHTGLVAELHVARGKLHRADIGKNTAAEYEHGKDCGNYA